MQEKGIKYVGFGSPLMDMIADVSSETIKKHNLNLNETVHRKMSETNILSVLEEEKDITYVAGGCSYNTMRVLNWMLRDENGKTALIGAVGDDKYGRLYSDLLKKENIVPIFETFNEINTGICAVYCNNRDRGHITDLGASVMISDKMFDEAKEVLKKAELIFTELYIIKHKKDFVFKLAELGSKTGKTFGFNLPSFYFIETYLSDIKNLLKYADIVFTNSAEANYFANLCDFQQDADLEDVCKFMASYEKKNKNKKRVVVITNGPDPAYVVEYDFVSKKFTFCDIFPVLFLDEEKIVDANGAGDAFAGGFLSMYMTGKSLDKCVSAGHWAASEIIQTRGCQFPKNCNFFF